MSRYLNICVYDHENFLYFQNHDSGLDSAFWGICLNSFVLSIQWFGYKRRHYFYWPTRVEVHGIAY